MPECELCGSRKANRKAKVEGIIIDVCDKCVKFGEEIAVIEIKPTKKKLPKLEELEKTVKPDFHKIVKRERNKKKLTQEELAKKLNEKPSVIKRIENGWEPSMKIIKKLEKFFGVNLIEELKEEIVEKKSKGTNLTIGDIVEVY